MPSNEQRRQAAKRKLERQMARREQQAKRRRTITVTSTIVAVVLLVAGVFYLTRTSGQENQATAQPGSTGSSAPAEAASAEPTSGPCGYTPTPNQPAAKPVELPPDPKPTPSKGTVGITLDTNRGTIELTLNRAKAPCTVQSFVHLTKSGFYDDTPCHRLTTSKALRVLQCGDPTGSGAGGPGYEFKDELPENLQPAPEKFQGSKGNVKVYPRGTLAMAKPPRPDSNGSQFFMVYEDSYLPPKYTVFGQISQQGLQVLDEIAAKGTKQGSSKPKQPVIIEDATVKA